MSDELKPCPFCGSRKIRIDHCTKRVRCATCFATSGLITPHKKDGMTDQEAAIATWNERCENAENDG